ncbi:MAG: DUF695 domain-containing protein [Bacteroidota bacterium]
MNQSVNDHSHTEWDFYFCTVEDKPASIMLDLALIDQAPIIGKIDFIQVAIDLKHPNEHGLTTAGEAEVLYVMEDRLAEHMGESLGGIYAARNTTNSQRIFYFYCNSSIGHKAIIEEVMESFPAYSYSINAHLDTEWAFYLQFIYPSRLEYQSILNRRVLDKIGQHGDPMTEARNVDHYIHFDSEQDREDFIQEVLPENFSIVKKGFDPVKSTQAYSLIVSRSEQMESSTIDEAVFYLIQAAEACQGEYDGWETGVILK